MVKISMEGVERMDASFASEAIVGVVGRYRKSKGICLIDLSNSAIRLNIDLAAERIGVPVTVWNRSEVEVVGLKPSAGNRDALDYALSRPEVRTVMFAEVAGISIANASTKFKQLWEQGFLMRTEGAADSGGVEFLYRRIG
ncbi:DNA-binding protein [Mesorhizobium sp. M7A.F.Ca.US.001.04.1.1]|uniref:DNA-binding protein n=1 Tax=unclassified Mesorhizobium TaxID=325217 RepID=UPI000FC9CDCE|nr:MULTISPECIES: DNA-binding protein [unclassified Mesorhizobium]RUY22841.1 DNA-binding protein [Mesorhizobium sp. M7A.F.Ca.US.001.04.2.1]RUY34721.1 DNA-binding protein [Mesorhizobium sp. M7A.F.Ca.US.001.04.1.1]